MAKDCIGKQDKEFFRQGVEAKIFVPISLAGIFFLFEGRKGKYRKWSPFFAFVKHFY